MLKKVLKDLLVKTSDGGKKYFSENPTLNYDGQINCFVVSEGLEDFIFPIANIIYILGTYENKEEIVIPSAKKTEELLQQ